MQFEVLDSLSNPSLTTTLTDVYDQYLEDWVGDYWLQPKFLPEGFKVCIQFNKSMNKLHLVSTAPN